MLNIVIYLLAVNILGFLLMWSDKNASKSRDWRISQKALFITALAGGSIGVWYGMYKFRHKTKHPSFKYGIPLIIILQFVAFWRFRLY